MPRFAPELTQRVENAALVLHKPATLAAYVEMSIRWPAYMQALVDNSEGLHDTRKELLKFRLKQYAGKCRNTGAKLSRRDVQAYVDANLYLAWAMNQIDRQECEEAGGERCYCTEPVTNIRHGKGWCSNCERWIIEMDYSRRANA